jgi:molecular chaperone IbpA
MTTLDFSPLFRSAVGFDRLASMLEQAGRNEAGTYPPYNIERIGEHEYCISLAVAGFTEADLDIHSHEDTLIVTGRKSENAENQDRKFLHRGIATRNFERRFQLADYVRVKGARLEHGLLHVDLVREVPEAMKPRKIEIGGPQEKPLIDGEVDKPRVEDAA